MAPLSHPVSTIRTQVYDIIKQNICDGVYTPGQRLQETELAASLHVSRSPIREALRQLASDGLVEEFPNRGVFVKEFTAHDIQEVFDVRVLLESYAILHSPAHMTPARMEELMGYLDQLEHYHQQDQLEDYIRVDAQLHQAIIRLGGNRVVEQMYERVHSLIQQFRIYSLTSKQRFDESVVEHRTVVHCLLTGNVEEVDRVNQAHLTLARDKIGDYLNSQAGRTAAP